MKGGLLRRCVALASAVAVTAAFAWAPAWADAPSDHAAEANAATQQASAWLGALDLGHYDEAWNGLATVMQAGTTQDVWSNDIRGPREQLGKPLGRDLQRAQYATAVRGAPTGQYVTATYLSRFADAPSILETVLLSLDDGRWRVAGYSVGPAPDASVPAAEQAPGGAKPAP